MLLAFCTRLATVSELASKRIDHKSCLFDLLRSTRARKASDDRDKVYSVLGLVTTWLAATPIVPDYPFDWWSRRSQGLAEVHQNGDPDHQWKGYTYYPSAVCTGHRAYY